MSPDSRAGRCRAFGDYMKITCTTIYEGADEEFVRWYADNLKRGGVPENVWKDLAEKHEASFTSSFEGMRATTTYKVE